MLKNKIEQIANNLGAEYNYSEEIVPSTLGSRMPISYHDMRLTYRNVSIFIHYEFGNLNLGRIDCSIEQVPNFPDFSITIQNPLIRIFRKNKNRFDVKCSNSTIKSFLENELHKSQLSEIVSKTQFEPTIEGKASGNNFQLQTKFYLGFTDKEKAIIPLVEFYKTMIDEIEKGSF